MIGTVKIGVLLLKECPWTTGETGRDPMFALGTTDDGEPLRLLSLYFEPKLLDWIRCELTGKSMGFSWP